MQSTGTSDLTLADAVAPSLPLGPDGVTSVEDVALDELARAFGTPLWIVSGRQLRDNLGRLSAALEQQLERFEIAYSMKANNNRAVLQLLARAGALIDCSSEHELAIAIAAGVPAHRVVVNGNGKSERYLDAAVRLGVRQVNVDSTAEVERLARIAAVHDATVSCVVRLKLSYERLLAQDPSYERTLRVAEAKFGSSVETADALAVVARIQTEPRLRYRGVSHHAGFAGYRADFRADRQLMHLRECGRELAEFAAAVRDRLGLDTDRIDVGGGLRSGRCVLLSTPGDGSDAALHELPTAEEYAAAIADGVGSAGLPVTPTVQLETGGYQVGNAVTLLVEVLDVKDVERLSPRRFVTVDASMSMFTARGMTRVGYPVVAVGRPLDAAPAALPVEVVGPTCAYDSIAEGIALPDVAPGDLLAVLNQGAYCEVLSTQFNAFPRPAVVLVDGARAELVRRRETLADIVGRELGTHELWPEGPEA